MKFCELNPTACGLYYIILYYVIMKVCEFHPTALHVITYYYIILIHIISYYIKKIREFRQTALYYIIQILIDAASKSHRPFLCIIFFIICMIILLFYDSKLNKLNSVGCSDSNLRKPAVDVCSERVCSCCQMHLLVTSKHSFCVAVKLRRSSCWWPWCWAADAPFI